MTADRLSPVTGYEMANEPAPSGRRWSPRGARESIQPVAPPEPPAPPRRPRGSGILAKLSAFFTFLVFVAFAGGAAFIYAQSSFTSAGPLTQDKVVFIPRNTGTSDIAQLLQQEGVVSNATMFEISHLLSGRKALKAGEYLFKAAASLEEVRETLSEGRSIQHRITLPEGLTSEQIVGRLMENDILVGEVRMIPREGTLLPDTYPFERGTTREQLLSRIEQAQRRLLQDIWSKRSPDVPVRTPNDLVILASIVEKETGRADERTRVAAVFINRLNRGMRLESDPTIIYGLVGGKGSLGRGIAASEIRAPTPYNTYVINGLPPGPIANPGRASLEATANPSRTRDLFFVADGTGGHAFAETYEQHQRNVIRWRQLERGEPPSAPPVQSPPPAAAQPRPGQRSDAPLVFPELQQAAVPQTTNRAEPGRTTEAASNVSRFAIPQANLDVFAPANPGQPIGPVRDEAPLPDVGGVESYPVAPGRRQAMQRNAVSSGSGMPMMESDVLSSAYAPEDAAPVVRRGPNRGFDAVEGSKIDPLKNKTFDLSHPKVIPTLR
jgi:UPF0755 protein